MPEPAGPGDERASIWWEPQPRGDRTAAGTERPLSRHLWTPVSWQEADGWPDARLRTVCGLVIPRTALPGAPGASCGSGGPAPPVAEALRLCGRCARIQASRDARAE